MKILFSIDEYYSHNNGTTISAHRYADMLRHFGHEVRIITYVPLSERDHIGDDIYALDRLTFPIIQPLLEAEDFNFAKTDLQVIEKAVRWADVVHIYLPYMMDIAVRDMALKMGKPLTSAFHVQAENITSAFRIGKCRWANNLIYKLHWRTFYNRLQYIHCPSAFMADELKSRGYDADLRVITNGISDDFQYCRPPMSKRFGDKIVITMVGRLAAEKRQDLIMKAVRMSKYASQIQVLFAGKGPMEKAYRRMAERFPENKPIFGYYNRQQLIDLLHETHIYVHASDFESEAIGCIEAFATGLLPIISDSRQSATKQFALDERSLFRAGDAKDLARKIDYWIEHPQEREQMEKQYAAQADNYRLEAAVRQFEQMLNDAVANTQKTSIQAAKPKKHSKSA